MVEFNDYQVRVKSAYLVVYELSLKEELSRSRNSLTAGAALAPAGCTRHHPIRLVELLPAVPADQNITQLLVVSPEEADIFAALVA